MPNLELPQEALETLLKIAGLENTIKDQIIVVLSQYKKSDSFTTIFEEINANTNIDIDLAEEFVDTYRVLIRSKHRYKLTNEELLSDVNENIEDLEEKPSEAEVLLLQDWMTRLLNISNKDILVSTLAYGYVAANNNLYFNSNIYEELRPVFVDDNLSGLALYHTLKMHYELPDKRHSDIYFVLDDTDLDDLIDLLIKAKTRTEAIKHQYKNDLINI